MLALSRPSAASFACWTRSAINDVSSRKITTPPLRFSPSGAKCGRILLEPSAEPNASTRSPPTCVRQAASCSASDAETPRSASSVLRVPTEVLRSRAVDEPNPIFAVDHDDALAQMLDDVFVELDDVAQVEAALLGERFGLDDSRAQQLHDGRDHENRGAEDPDGRVLRARRHALQLRDRLLG